MSTNRVLNWAREPKDERDYKSTRRLAAPETIPSEYELPLQIPVYDQLDIGSCVANSAASCYRFESAQVIGNFSFDPSRLFVYYNARKIQGWEKEDSGAYIRDGFKAMNKWGLPNERIWPYKTEDFAKEPTVQAYTDGEKNIIVEYAKVPQTELSIKQTILAGGAVSFGFDVYSSFFGAWPETSGIMPIPKKGETFEGGHAVTIIGWSDVKKCFLIQNSWGKAWGQDGKFWMPYSYVLSSKSDDFWAIERIKIDAAEPVPPTPADIDWKLVCSVLFKNSKELWAVRKSTLIRIGVALRVQVDEKKSFRYNYELIKEHLGL